MTLNNTISRFAGNIIGGISATSTGDVTISPMPTRFEEDGSETVLTTVDVIVSPNVVTDYANDVGAEEFRLVSGTLNADGSGTYSQNIRGISNISEDVFPIGNVAWQTAHQDSAPVIIDPTYLLRALDSSFTNAISEIQDETGTMVVRMDMLQKSADQRQVDEQDDYETAITLQQNNYETAITLQQDTYEDEVDIKIAAFDARQALITGTINATDATQLDISGGNWLNGTTTRTFTSTSVNPTLSQTTYYSLQAGTGTLITATSRFESGDFPICKVVTSATVITSVTNYGAYVIPPATEGFLLATNFVYDDDGYLINFDDSDSVTWTLTYNDDGQILTMADGTDTTTFAYNANGEFTGAI